MPLRNVVRRSTPALAAAVLVLLAACDGNGSATPKPQPTKTVTSTTTVTAPSPSGASPSVGTSRTPSPTRSPTPSVSPTSRPALADRLLTAHEMPGFTRSYRWNQGSTATKEPKKLFGTCERFSITSIGATHVAVRDYTPVASDSVASAGHLVAQFPDSATARRAYAVLTAWHDRCADRISQHKTHRVGDLQSVDVGPSAIGDWYLLTYGPVPHYPQDGYFDAQGMTLVGHRIAMLEMVLTGQDYNYRRGHEPMVAAVKAAAAKLR